MGFREVNDLEDDSSVGAHHSATTLDTGAAVQRECADSDDGWTLAFSWVWIAVFSPAMIAPFFPNVDAVLPLLLTFFLVLFVAIAHIAIFIFLVCMRRWRNILSMIIGPFPALFLTVGLFVSSYPVMPYFLLHKSGYLEQVKREPLNENGEMLFWVGSFGIVGSTEEYFVAYDPSERTEKEIGRINGASVQRLAKNFYFLAVAY